MFTDWRDISYDNEELLKDVNIGLFLARALQKVSNLIQKKEFK